jgi:poly-gamma-glutamate capsule biosynthesis protein CapA/YwtB (metallophosphatase superfamily)
MSRKSGLLLVLLFLILLTGALFWRFGAPPPVANGEPAAAEVTLLALGDLVVHAPIINSCYDPAAKNYDFRPIFAGMRAEISQADLAVTTLEIPISGSERKFTGYPAFNSPYSLADALQWSGFDLVFTASNHSLDQGYTGLQSTQAHLDQIGLAYVGSRRSIEQPRYRMVEAQGMKLAFLSYTTITNGLNLPPGKEWALNRLDPQNLAPLAVEVKAARQAGADAVIVALHNGVEYQREPSPEEQRLFHSVLQLGVDIILGSHVHVIQPRESGVKTGPGGERAYYIAYSLGNLLSNQYWRYSDCGLGVTLKLSKRTDGPGLITKEADHFPIWVDRYDQKGRLRYRLLRLAGPEAPNSDPDLSPDDRTRMRQVWQDTETLLGSWEKSPLRLKP